MTADITQIAPPVDPLADEALRTIDAAMLLNKRIDSVLYAMREDGGHVHPGSIHMVTALVTTLDLLVEDLVDLSDDQHELAEAAQP